MMQQNFPTSTVMVGLYYTTINYTVRTRLYKKKLKNFSRVFSEESKRFSLFLENLFFKIGSVYVLLFYECYKLRIYINSSL